VENGTPSVAWSHNSKQSVQTGQAAHAGAENNLWIPYRRRPWVKATALRGNNTLTV